MRAILAITLVLLSGCVTPSAPSAVPHSAAIDPAAPAPSTVRFESCVGIGMWATLQRDSAVAVLPAGDEPDTILWPFNTPVDKPDALGDVLSVSCAKYSVDNVARAGPAGFAVLGVWVASHNGTKYQHMPEATLDVVVPADLASLFSGAGFRAHAGRVNTYVNATPLGLGGLAEMTLAEAHVDAPGISFDQTAQTIRGPDRGFTRNLTAVEGRAIQGFGNLTLGHCTASCLDGSGTAHMWAGKLAGQIDTSGVSYTMKFDEAKFVLGPRGGRAPIGLGAP